MTTINRTPTLNRSVNFLGRKTLVTLTRRLHLLAGMAAGLWSIQDLRAVPAVEDEEYKAAMQATIEVVRKHKACPTDPAAFDKFVAQVFPMLYPRLANREREQDPEYLKRLAAVKEEVEQAKQREAEALKDPAVRAQREQSLRAFLSTKSAREIEDAVIRQAELVRQRETEQRERESQKPVQNDAGANTNETGEPK